MLKKEYVFLNKQMFKKKVYVCEVIRVLFLPVAAAKSFQLCPTLCDPVDSSPQAPLSLGFSRQEYLSGVPFPSPMHESEK